MSNEFLDYIEDILDAMEKAETLVQDVSYNQKDKPIYSSRVCLSTRNEKYYVKKMFSE